MKQLLKAISYYCHKPRVERAKRKKEGKELCCKQPASSEHRKSGGEKLIKLLT
jgi:hypothetical protein